MDNNEHHRMLGLDAIILIADDIAGQKRFYGEVLGLPIEADYGDAVFFRVGGQKLGIFSRDHHPEGTRRLGGATHGISHIEFRVAESDRSELASKLRNLGFEAYGDNYSDADGNLFHFNVDPDR